MNEHDTILGKHILIGLTYLDRHGDIARQVQLHGTISRIAEHTLYFDRADGAGEFSIPFDGELDSADPEDTYTLRSSGEAVTGVHFIASWTVHPNPDAD
ncbi:MAG TPA: hypothetical protein VF774_23535 [Pseudoduganella sp.]|jgi:hypothetical protein